MESTESWKNTRHMRHEYEAPHHVMRAGINVGRWRSAEEVTNVGEVTPGSGHPRWYDNVVVAVNISWSGRTGAKSARINRKRIKE